MSYTHLHNDNFTDQSLPITLTRVHDISYELEDDIKVDGNLV